MLAQPMLEKLSDLRLEGMLMGYKEQMENKNCKSLSFEERLGLLVDREMTIRENKKLKSRLRAAKLRLNACVEDLDFKQPRGLDKSQVMALASCRWISDHNNCLIVGPTGAGKSYLACALGQKACRESYRVLYLRFPRLLEELDISRAEGKYLKILSNLAKFDLLILDDWASMPLVDQQRRALFEILEDRYDRKSTLVSAQIPVEKWHEALGNPTLSDAILDRLVHNAHRVTMKGESMRKTRQSLKK
jgi:DNA replication protein DnaC